MSVFEFNHVVKYVQTHDCRYDYKKRIGGRLRRGREDFGESDPTMVLTLVCEGNEVKAIMDQLQTSDYYQCGISGARSTPTEHPLDMALRVVKHQFGEEVSSQLAMIGCIFIKTYWLCICHPNKGI